ncbi:type II secretion system F family protein [Microbaculum marinisediminis]|uniref:Type II secretion system F family protein n=1 Tax=Microbaculum marinisediminis TaxID=2931392 RepID=A0AAW5QYD6_9HYPH|nr:type II secretion system F family protein [Microbaculum sp. A6E488]MCT8972010.1 type II secretion system F family protein [Microbaculum sp. A6E488]
MLDDRIISLAIAVMATIAVGGVAWVFVYPLLSGERRTEKRVQTVAGRRNTGASIAKAKAEAEAGKRRKAVQETLKELESKQKARKRPPLRVRIAQAGLKWSVKGYLAFSVGVAFVFTFFGLIFGAQPIVLLAIMIFSGVGIPYWMLGFLKKRRMKKFLQEFPNAVDVIVRGVKAGLPLGDCLRIVAGEVQEPVKTEFRHVVESQALGLPLADCVERMYDGMPLPEVNFFAIVISIQQKAGGNLSEALGNLAKVLRDRKKMQGKIQAMSQEAKASAAIIGALPVAVMILVFVTTPSYISLLWTERLGHIMLAGCAVWMLMGVLVMKKMINFKF